MHIIHTLERQYMFQNYIQNIHHDAPEDKTEEVPSNDYYENGLSSYDEENIGCRADERPYEDNRELDFNY